MVLFTNILLLLSFVNMEKLPPKPRKTRGLNKEELSKLSKNELIDRIIQLEAHNFQLKNIISKTVSVTPKERQDQSASKKPFNFSNCYTRRVLLRILYFGWDYQGFAVQENSNQTIEHQVFYALTKSCLIGSREESQYHRCGRTDKGVSSFGQVISITLRSKFPQNEQMDKEMIDKELPYCKILNRLLPKDIRAVCWAPIPIDKPEFSARFDCKKRQYKYYFPQSNLNIPAMKEACTYLIGSKDFRNLCKMDVGNGVTEFIRNILNADIIAFDVNSRDPTSMCYLLIEGNAFLWHQIRCIMGILLLIGQGKESPKVILDLLDVEKNPRKPQYNMALDLPLNLFDCQYDMDSNWIYDLEELSLVLAQLQSEYTQHSIRTTMIKDVIGQLESEYLRRTSETEDETLKSEKDSVISYADCLLQGVKPKNYIPLLQRDTCSSLDEKIEYYRKRRRIAEPDDNERNEENIFHTNTLSKT